jgi:hypothetical protein
MTTIADFKKGVSMPRAKLPPRKKTRAEVRRATKNSEMKFNMAWEELRAMTREP